MTFPHIFVSILDFIFPKSDLLQKIENTRDVELEQYSYKENVVCRTEYTVIYALFRYQCSIIRHMVWQLKYKNNEKIAAIFAKSIYKEITRLLKMRQYGEVVVMAMPNSAARRKARGGNQCELLTKHVVLLQERFTNPLPIHIDNTILCKIKETPRQASTSRTRRLINIKGCFIVPEEKIPTIFGTTVIIIDDVVTTGSTLTEAARTLCMCGAKNVIGIAVAH